MRKIIFFVLSIFFTCSCLAQELSKGNKYNSGETPLNIGSIVTKTEDFINVLNAKLFKLETKTVIVNNTTKLEGYIDKSKNLQKLIIQGTNNEGAHYIESVYFDNSTDNIIFSIPFGNGEVMNTIFTKERDVLSYSVQGNKKTLGKFDSFSKESKISTFMARLDPYMSLLGINHETVNPSLNSMPVITTYIDSVEMRESPNSSGVLKCHLKRHERLYYLGSTKSIDSINNLKWVWYKVATEDKKQIGWVFGHPNYIIDLNTDNWEE